MKLQAFCLGLITLIPAWSQPLPQIEPTAGAWKTWVISSGKDFRVPPPPDAAATRAELDWLHANVGQSDPRIAEQIRIWDAGSPGYQWLDLIANRSQANQPLTPYSARVFAYLTMAMYDATVAAWDPNSPIIASAQANWTRH